MALVHHLQKGYKEKDSIHRSTECSYYIVHNKKGEKFLQLDTYGSAEREIPGKISQTIQFSPEAIEQLRQILATEFK